MKWLPYKRPSTGCAGSTSINIDMGLRHLSSPTRPPVACRRCRTRLEPKWARVNYPKIDYQDLYYYSAPKPKKTIGSLDEIDPEILKTYEKLGSPPPEDEGRRGVVRQDGEKGLGERRIAVDAVF